MIILNLSPKLNKIFTYLGLINIFKVFDDKIQALTHLGAKL